MQVEVALVGQRVEDRLLPLVPCFGGAGVAVDVDLGELPHPGDRAEGVVAGDLGEGERGRGIPEGIGVHEVADLGGNSSEVGDVLLGPAPAPRVDPEDAEVPVLDIPASRPVHVGLPSTITGVSTCTAIPGRARTIIPPAAGSG